MTFLCLGKLFWGVYCKQETCCGYLQFPSKISGFFPINKLHLNVRIKCEIPEVNLYD